MINLILLIVFGIVIGSFSTQNTLGVPLTLANYTFSSVPLYLIALGSLLIGIFMSWIISLVHSISASMQLSGKNAKIKDAYHTIEKLEKDNHDLEVENARLKGETHTKKVIVDHEPTDTRPSFGDKLKQSFS